MANLSLLENMFYIEHVKLPAWDNSISGDTIRKQIQHFKLSLKSPLIYNDTKYVQRLKQSGKCSVNFSFIICRPPYETLNIEALEMYKIQCKSNYLNMLYDEFIYNSIKSWIIVISDINVDINLAFEFAKTIKYNDNTYINICHSPTTMWNDPIYFGDIKRVNTQKFKLTLTYPLVDHPLYYAQKVKGMKGPAKISQTFIISRAYYGALTIEELNNFKEQCQNCNLNMLYEESIFRGNKSWLILISDNDVNIETALQFAKTLPNK